MSRLRNKGLDTFQAKRLNDACEMIHDGLNHRPYLVGTAASDQEWRDVDVRSILPDDEFDQLFADNEPLWSLLCFTITHYLRDATGLPVDFQIQRMTEANEQHKGPRHALAMPVSFAGGGDATKFSRLNGGNESGEGNQQ